MTEYNICIMPGDGIGPEIMEQGLRALKVLKTATT